MPWLFFFSALSIPAFYGVGLLANSGQNFTTTDFWRFWVVHLWVEDFLELFTTILVAYIFVLIGVVHERTALRMIYLDIILYSVGGIVGTMHHVYFSGEPALHMAMGAFFSAAEVIPLTFLTVEAWSFLQLGTTQGEKSATPFPHYWAVMFLAAVGFWNFLGRWSVRVPDQPAGRIVLRNWHSPDRQPRACGHDGRLRNAGGGTRSLLSSLHYSPERWSDRAAGISFWSLNLGLAWMVFATLFPLGMLQLYHSVSVSYYDARTLNYIGSHANAILEWLRMPGDVVFIVGGALPILYLTLLGNPVCEKGSRMEESKEILFADVITQSGGNR